MSVLRRYQDFCLAYKLPNSWPIPTKTTLHFIAYLSIQNLSTNTVQLYVRALSYLHKIRLLPDPTKSILVIKSIQGLKRTNGKKPDTRRPITIHILQKVVHALPQISSSHYEMNLFKSAFCLAYFGLLRVGEITVANQLSIKNHHAIRLQDVNINTKQNQIQILIPHSKTDQIGHQTTLVIKSEPKFTSICPVQTLCTFRTQKPSTIPSCQFFVHSDTTPLTRYQFNAILQKALVLAGVKGHFATHSFRIGRATDMALRGVPDSDIKKSGRWKSDAFISYIRI